MRTLKEITEQCNQRIPEQKLVKKCDACGEIKTRGDFSKSASGERVAICEACIGIGHEAQCRVCGTWTFRSRLTKKKITEGVFRLMCDACLERYGAYCSRKNSEGKGIKQWIASLPRKFVLLKRSAPGRKENQNGS